MGDILLVVLYGMTNWCCAKVLAEWQMPLASSAPSFVLSWPHASICDMHECPNRVRLAKQSFQCA